MAYTTIDKPDLYFNTKLWSGNGSTQSITGVNFQPDLVWIKATSGTQGGSDHHIYDLIRGVNVKMSSNSTGGDGTISDTLTSFDSDGYSLGFRTRVNGSGTNYAGWNWLASNTTASNTDGDITSTVSANTTSGFSIVSFTGNGGSDQQVGHGLGTTPTLYITKDRTNGSTNWHYHTTQIDGGMDFGKLNLTDAFASSSLSAPSSTTIRVGGTINTSSANFISYVFAEKKGFSKFGSYTGNGQASTNSPFIYTGFKPAFVIIKNTIDTHGWSITDNKRNGYNENSVFLYANTSDADVSYPMTSFYSNGFQPIEAGADKGATNQNGDTYIYMAFAENPFVTSGGIPTTAR